MFESETRPITVTPDSNQFKNYGDPDPALTYTITSGSLVTGDSFSGALARDPGNNVGLYNITQGTLALGANYNLTFTTGVKFEIKKRPLQVTADAGQFKNYGDSDPTLTYTVTSGSVLAGDSFIGALSRASGNNVGTYAITLGTLSLGTNYELTLTAGSTFEIKKRPLQVTADAGQFKNYGDSDPTLTYTVTSGSVLAGDSFIGALSRATGNKVGYYDITLGSMSIGTDYGVTT